MGDKNEGKVLLLNTGKRQYKTKSGDLSPGKQLAVGEKEAKELLVYKDLTKVSDYVEPKGMRELKADLKKSKAENKDLKAKLAAAGGSDPEAEAKAKAEAEAAAKKKKDEAAAAAKKRGGSGK